MKKRKRFFLKKSLQIIQIGLSLHHFFRKGKRSLNMVNVAQLVRALDCGSRGRGFKSHLSPIKACKSMIYRLYFYMRISVASLLRSALLVF